MHSKRVVRIVINGVGDLGCIQEDFGGMNGGIRRHLICARAKQIVEPHEGLANLVSSCGAGVEIDCDLRACRVTGVGRLLPKLRITGIGVAIQPLSERSDGHRRIGRERPHDGTHLRRGTGVARAIHIFNRAQQVVQSPSSRCDSSIAQVRPVKHGGNLVVLVVVVFIPRDDQQAVVRPRPNRVGIEIGGQPIVSHFA